MQNFFRIAGILIFVLHGCVDTVESDDLLDVDDKTYINGYLSPSDTLVTVYVSRALPAVGTPLSSFDAQSNIDTFVIKDAVVTISDADGNSILLPYDAETFSYRVAASEFPINQGATYLLNVFAAGREYRSSCSIPKKISEITETVSQRLIDSQFLEIGVNIAFQDFEGEDNFYIIGGNIEEGTGQELSSYPLLIDLERFTTDDLGDGVVLSADAISPLGFSPSPEGEMNENENRLVLQVANAEEPLYQSLRTSFLNDFNEGNPFLEYSIAPNNIEGEGGVGVFAGYQLTEKEVMLEIKENP